MFRATHRPSSGIAATGNQKHMYKPEVAITVFELVMMGGVLPETC
jgi:hypothetical protein